MNRTLIETEEALLKKELILYIKGIGKYELPNPWIETPIDLDSLFIQGFNAYVKKNGRDTILHDEITNALISLCDNPVDLWWCVFFVHDYYFGYKEDELLFSFEKKSVFESIHKSIGQHKNSLIHNMSYVGYRFEKGLWGHVENMVLKLNSKFPETIIKLEV